MWKIKKYDQDKRNCNCQTDPDDRATIEAEIERERAEVEGKVNRTINNILAERQKKNATEEKAKNLVSSLQNKTFVMLRYIEDPSEILDLVETGQLVRN